MAVPAVFANPESLTALTDAINQTLVDTGRFFKSSGSFQSRLQLKRSIPASYDRFQIALDNLSEQIFIAKAFLENDYEAITAKRNASKIEAASTVPPAEDVVMSEAPQPSGDEPSQDKPKDAEQPSEPLVKTETPAAPEAVPEAGSEAVPTEDTLATKQEEEKPGAAEATADTVKQEEATRDNEQAAAPPAASGDELNFDSMLASEGTNNNEFDINFNFDNDEIGNQNFLDGTDFLASGKSAPAAEGANTQPEQDPTSISSLLPGLESYAADSNAGGDFNLELQKLNESSDNQSGVNVEGNNGHDDILAPGESSFDDLFLEKDHHEGGDDSLLGGNNGGMMELGELDDNWFN